MSTGVSDEFRLRTLQVAQEWVSRVVMTGDTVVDATVGNGYDTLFLSRLVGESGQVIGFDIQKEALDSTHDLLSQMGEQEGEDYLSRVTLHHACHSMISEYWSDQIAACMFNLGYLPKGDKSIITQKETTLTAINAHLDLLKKNGIMTVVCYPGHDGGGDEAEVVSEWMGQLSTREYSVLQVSPMNALSKAPYLIGVQKNF